MERGGTMKNITIVAYQNQEDILLKFIKAFWLNHNDVVQTDAEAKEDLVNWTAEGHIVYFIMLKNKPIGFLHLGSRGAGCNWLEDFFVLSQYQGNGYGKQALTLLEEIVEESSDSLYLEVSARNLRALKLYHDCGYDCLNTVTLRKDFKPNEFEIIQTEVINQQNFKIKRKI